MARIVWDPHDPFAEPDAIERIVFGTPTHPDLALLIDPERGRYFLGSPLLVRSTFIRLMLLGAPSSERFEKVFERRVELGERVTAWRVRWPEDR